MPPIRLSDEPPLSLPRSSRKHAPRLSLALAAALLLLAACSRPTIPAAPYDPALLAEIQNIKAFDNHAHPVLSVAPGQKPDRDFDALPVDNMEPSADPVIFRAGNPLAKQAARALYGSSDPAAKQKMMTEKGVHYPEWVLDQMGVEVMLANRVEMGEGVKQIV